ncbi:PREDICTED: UDP-glucuronosyltransferase 2B7-like [Habropoda laboriosa]|nr:PREDICTED: UDP-glucuronosyltransferase 2B7-like [Habropoda laboriosa]
MTSNPVNCGRILVIVLGPSYSHQILFRSLTRKLAERGHEVVFVTNLISKNSSLTNYTEIDFTSMRKLLEMDRVTTFIPKYNRFTKYEVDDFAFSMGHLLTEYFYTHPEIKKIYAPGSNEKFDLVIVEGLISCGAFAIAHMLNVPYIAMISTDLHMYHNYLLGAPILPTHLSNWELFHYISPDMSFWERLQAFAVASVAVHHWYDFQTGEHEKSIRNIVGVDLPPFYDIAKNMSLLLVNQNPLLGYARPLAPNVIEYTSFHIAEDPPPLTPELSEFLGNATDGFIYMSLGCTMRPSQVLARVVKEIYNAFSRLPYKVLWKYDGDDIPKRNGNVLTSEWIPQESVLAHPNIKLFIFQGGMQSAEEAVYYGVPLLGVPIIFDQTYRIRKLVSLGVCKMVDVSTVDEETFYNAIFEIINNKSYKESMTELSRLMKDKPYESKEQIIWWVEYVMRHKGAPHLRFSGADDPWYQRYDMDIIAFLSIISFVVTIISAILLLRTLRWLYKHLQMFLWFSKCFCLTEGKKKVE